MSQQLKYNQSQAQSRSLMSEVINQSIDDNQSSFTFCEQETKPNPEILPQQTSEYHSISKNQSNNNQSQIFGQINDSHRSNDLQKEQQKHISQSKQNLKNDKYLDHEAKINSAIIKQSEQYVILRTYTDPNQYESEQVNKNGQEDVYRQLTLRLEAALTKISNSRKIDDEDGQEIHNNFLKRSKKFQEKKKKLIERKKIQIENQEVKQIKNKPTINKNSDKMCQNYGYTPIYQRVDRLMQEKKKKKIEQQMTKQKQLQLQESNFVEQYQKYHKPVTARNYDQYYQDIMRQQERKKQQNIAKKEQAQNKQIEGLTFKPTINAKSTKMVASQKRLPIDQRGLKKHIQTSTYSFKPQINRKRPKQ